MNGMLGDLDIERVLRTPMDGILARVMNRHLLGLHR